MSDSNKGVRQPPPQTSLDSCAETMMNKMLLDPQRYGWTAGGGVADLLHPHDRARRKSSKHEFLKQKRRRETMEASAKNTTMQAGTPASLPNHYMGSMFTPASTGESSHVPNSNRPMTTQKVPPVDTLYQFSVTPAQQQQVGYMPFHSAPHFARKPPPQVVGHPHVQQNLHSTTQTLGVNITPMSLNIDVQRRHSFPTSTLEPTKPPAAALLGTATAERFPHPAQQAVNTGLPASQPTPQTRDRPDPQKVITRGENGEEIISFKSLNDQGKLDMFSYHRGREGVEPRDPETGDLLCDMEPTDTNHGRDEPKMSVSVVVAFPLEDGTKTGDETSWFRETVTWDLSDPQTATPMAFAGDMAEEFGLSRGQTWDLAESIQNQLNDFTLNNCTYTVPVSVKCPLGHERATRPSAMSIGLYGGIFDDKMAGMSHPPSKRQRTLQHYGSFGASSVASSVASDRPRKSIETKMSDRRRVPPSVSLESDVEVEDEYLAEVQKRLKTCSIAAIEATRSKEGLTGSLVQVVPNSICHICHKRHKDCGMFPCRDNKHVYCGPHFETRLGCSILADTPINFCPICSLSCSCSKCVRRLNGIANKFKQKCISQGTNVEQTVFNDLFEMAVGPQPSSHSTVEVSRINRGKNAIARQHAIPPKRRVLPKVPASVFPMEVCGSKVIEAGTVDDYRRVYTAKGIYLRESPVSSSDDKDEAGSQPKRLNTNNVVEDGNLDHCHLCKNAGNLICCDFCPRAYHSDCIEVDCPKGETWECHNCLREKAKMPSDVIDGSAYHGMFSSLIPCGDDDTVNQEGIQTLSILSEMVTLLTKYDFGYMFKEPVDRNVPGYHDLIRNPMDLGTILSRLSDGHYVSGLNKETSWSDVIAAVLMDIELVWHNCFTFNFEGSAVHRMAMVLRRRADSIRAHSLDGRLSEDTERLVKEYVATCETERRKLARAAAANQTLRDLWLPKSKHKIVGKQGFGAKCLPVAALDPDTGSAVKVYTSCTSAFRAMNYIAGLGYPAEISFSTDVKVRELVKRSCDDPTLLLFGYRWLLLDNLRDQEVVFSSETRHLPSEIIEVNDRERSTTYFSVEEALSCPKLPKAIPLDSVRDELTALSTGNNCADVEGLSFRRFEPKESTEGVSSLAAPAGIPTLRKDWSRYCPGPVVVIQEDSLTSRALRGFKSVEHAYQDWLHTIQSSPAEVDEKTLSIEHFRVSYLDKERDVGGLTWRTVCRSKGKSDEGGTESGVKVGDDDDVNENMSVDPIGNESKDAPTKEKEHLTENEGATSVAVGTGGSSLPTNESAETTCHHRKESADVFCSEVDVRDNSMQSNKEWIDSLKESKKLSFSSSAMHLASNSPGFFQNQGVVKPSPGGEVNENATVVLS